MWIEACDNDKDAQTVLLAFDDQLGAECVYQDLEHRIPKSLLMEIKRIPCPEKNAPAEDHDLAIDAKRALLDVNMDHLFNDNLLAPCVKHRQQCPLYHQNRVSKRIRRSIARHGQVPPLTLRVAGTTCTAFSAYGKKEKMSHESAVPFLIWEAETLKRKPGIWLQENGPDFPVEMLHARLGALYQIISIVFSPIHSGYPVARLRRYSFGILMELLIFTGDMTEFINFICCTLRMDGQVYFIQPPAAVNDFIMQEAQKQGVYANSSSTQMEWSEMMDPASVQRLHNYKETWSKLVAKNSLTGISQSSSDHSSPAKSWIVDTSQYPEARYRAGVLLPTLMRSSRMYSFQKQRGLMPTEVILAQGILIHEDHHHQPNYLPTYIPTFLFEIA